MLSVVMSTYNRGHYLERSLFCYASASLNVPLELVVVDDDSTDGTADLVSHWAADLDITYIKVFKKAGLWRDCSSTINRGLRAARGDLIVGTHPEVMCGRQTLQDLWDLRAEKTYLAAKVYYLSAHDQEQLDTVDWKGKGPIAVRDIPGFYDEPSAELRGEEAYSHRATDRWLTWDSWVFGSMTRATWQWFGGLTEFVTWGSVDVDFLERRRRTGIHTLTPLSSDSIVVHQNHDVPGRPTDVPTPRDMDACLAALSHYNTEAEARKPW